MDVRTRWHPRDGASRRTLLNAEHVDRAPVCCQRSLADMTLEQSTQPKPHTMEATTPEHRSLRRPGTTRSRTSRPLPAAGPPEFIGRNSSQGQPDPGPAARSQPPAPRTPSAATTAKHNRTHLDPAENLDRVSGVRCQAAGTQENQRRPAARDRWGAVALWARLRIRRWVSLTATARGCRQSDR